MPGFLRIKTENLGRSVRVVRDDLRLSLKGRDIRSRIESAVRFGPDIPQTTDRREAALPDGSYANQIRIGGYFSGKSFIPWKKPKSFGSNYSGLNAPMRRSTGGGLVAGSSASRGGSSFEEMWLDKSQATWSGTTLSVAPDFGSDDGKRFSIYQRRSATIIKPKTFITAKNGTQIPVMMIVLRALYGIKLALRQVMKGFKIEPRPVTTNGHIAGHASFIMARFVEERFKKARVKK